MPTDSQLGRSGLTGRHQKRKQRRYFLTKVVVKIPLHLNDDGDEPFGIETSTTYLFSRIVSIENRNNSCVELTARLRFLSIWR